MAAGAVITSGGGLHVLPYELAGAPVVATNTLVAEDTDRLAGCSLHAGIHFIGVRRDRARRSSEKEELLLALLLGFAHQSRRTGGPLGVTEDRYPGQLRAATALALSIELVHEVRRH